MLRSANSHSPHGGFAPATPGFTALPPEWLGWHGATEAAPTIPAAESALRSHPCVALSSAQVLPEWINHNLTVHGFPANGDSPLNFLSHRRGSVQTSCFTPPTATPGTGRFGRTRTRGDSHPRSDFPASPGIPTQPRAFSSPVPMLLLRGAFRMARSTTEVSSIRPSTSISS